MRSRDITWLYWLESRSLFRRVPGLVYLLPYLLGSVFWRLSQIQFEWQRREIAVLPYGVLFCLSMLVWLRQYCWRFWLVFKMKPERLLIFCLLLIFGYGWTGYHWFRTDLNLLYRKDLHVQFKDGDRDHFSITVWMKAELTAMEGEGKDEKWVVWPRKMFFGENKELVFIPSLGLIPSFYPKVQVTVPQIREADYFSQSNSSYPQIGDTILLIGQLTSFPKATNPGQFDYQRFQRYSGIMGEMIEPKVYSISRPQFDLSRWLDKGKKAAYHYFQSHLNQKNFPLVISLLTGESGHMGDKELTKIRALGLSHLLAISGLHLGLVVMSLQKVLKLIPGLRKYHPWFLIIGIWLAVLFVGGRPSALRVGIYLTLSQVGKLLNRSVHSINLLAITAYLILLANPLTLFLLSFQLSFVVYLSILLFYEPIHYFLGRCLPDHFVIRSLGESLALSLAAFLGSAPIMLYHFYQISILGIFMNLWAVPLVGIILIGTLFSLGVGLILPVGGQIVIVVLDRLVGMFLRLVDYFYAFSEMTWCPGQPLLLWIGVFYLSLSLGWWFFQRKGMPIRWMIREKKRIITYVLLLIGMVGLSLIFPFQNPILEWVLLDVGQGDGMFLQLPNRFVMLVDGGGKLGNQSYYMGEKIVKPFLYSRGVQKIDLICITHFDADHVQGLIPVIRDFKVGRIWMPEGSTSSYVRIVQDLAGSKGIPITYPKKGDVYKIGDIILELLHPVRDVTYEKENDRSVVFRLLYGGRRLLFTGDLGEKEEINLVESQRELGAELLKVGHHGSKYSTSASFLEEVDPDLALISVGKNRYGHPSPELIKRLFDKKCDVLRTDESGAIQVMMRGEKIWVHKFQQK